MRFAKWYKGQPYEAPVLPPWDGGPVTIVNGTTTATGIGTLVGYTNNMRYKEQANVGSISSQLFRDVRTATVTTVRLIGLVSQGPNSYLVLAWQADSTPPDEATMPPFTHRLQLDGGTIYNFTSAPAAGTTSPTVSKYLTVNVAWAVGQTHTFAFV